MIVTMHNHEGGEIEDVYSHIGTADDPLHFLQLKNLFYSEEKLLECTANDTSKQHIVSFVNGSNEQIRSIDEVLDNDFIFMVRFFFNDDCK